MLEWLINKDGRAFVASGAVGLLAGLTQLYGVLPFLVGAVLTIARDRLAGRRIWPKVLFTISMGALGGLILWLWSTAIPHEDQLCQ